MAPDAPVAKERPPRIQNSGLVYAMEIELVVATAAALLLLEESAGGT